MRRSDRKQLNPNAERGTKHSISLRMKRRPRSRDKIESNGDVVNVGGVGNTCIIGNGDSDAVNVYGGGDNTFTLGNGNGDVVNVSGFGSNTFTLGNGTGDTVTISGGAGGNTVTVAGNDAILTDTSGGNADILQ